MAQLIYKSNKEIAEVFNHIGFFLDIEGVAFKPRAYQKAAETILDLTEDVFDIYRHGGLKSLEKISGVGVSIAEKIEEFLKKEKISYLEDLKKKWPIKIEEFIDIEGLGPKTVSVLHKQLNIKNLKELEVAIKQNKISKLEGFGEKSQAKILKSIEFYKKSGGRAVFGFIMPEIKIIKENLEKIKGVERVDIAGSVRRKKETIGDIDFLVISKNSKPVMDFFVSMPQAEATLIYGEKKSSIRLKNGLDADLMVALSESHGSALNYFTGSKDHGIALREIAIKKGWKLNEYGLFKFKNEKLWERIAGATENEIYEKLGLKYIEPELREMRGEIQAAQKNKLPKLIGYKDLLGDLQIQTNWSDGANSIEEMARIAMQKGLKYIVITDHTKHLTIAHGLDEKRLKQQWKEIEVVNKKFEKEGLDFKVLKGSECDILKDGSLDLPDNILIQLDVVGASIHSNFNLSEEEQTNRMVKAMNNKNVDIIFHPTGRIINQRDAYKLDINKIIKTAKETGTILEINAFPNRLDLKDEYIKQCVDIGVKMSIDSDAHSAKHLDYLEYGIAQARRGWAEKKNIINAWPVDKMLKMLK